MYERMVLCYYKISEKFTLEGIHIASSVLRLKLQLAAESTFCLDRTLILAFVPVICCCMSCAKSLQSCPTLCDPMDCSPPGSSIHGDSPGKNTGVGCHALLQQINQTQ